ncbi:MAG: oligosaccharide repeat unit polymerase [Chlorobi bacterium]|nr:oligosaccharide repeat unit polymerase [Chlorobiota bacterium]
MFSFLDREMYIYNSGIEIIAFYMLVFQAGSVLVLHKSKLEFYEHTPNFSIERLRILQVIGIGLSSLGIYITMHQIADFGGINLSVQNLSDLTVINSKARYSGIRIASGLGFYLGIFDFATVIVGGILLAARSGKVIALTPIFLGLYKTYITGARASILISLIFFFTSFVFYKAYLNKGRLPLFTYKSIRYAVLSVILFVLLFLVVQMTRGGVTDFNRIPAILKHLNNWFFAYLPGFSIWLDSYRFNEVHFGSFTFAGIFDQLNIAHREQGLYREFVFIGRSYRTNVFTIYRGLILDFHVFSFLLMYLMGSVATISFHKFYQLGAWTNFFIIITIYSFFLWQHTVSIFNYNTILAGVLLAFFMVQLSSFKYVYK